ncbi:hypothetical protein ACFUCV_10945 [Specibacter sp. NPDC057265]|uniref:hypothetical protein n=1 Tax=Specibacter sp. NPDC057265 TaxID=3346075 RepID=UPI003630283A
MTHPSSRPGSNAMALRRALAALAITAAAVCTSACSAAGPAQNPATGTSTQESSAAPPTASGSVSAQPPAGSPAATAEATAEVTATATTQPTAQTAVGSLVEGFPVASVPLMEKARIQVSSTERAGALSQAAVTASITASSAEVLAHYTKVFAGQGFTAQPGEAVDGVPLKTFVRSGGRELATVSVSQDAGTATFTVGVTLLQAAFK